MNTKYKTKSSKILNGKKIQRKLNIYTLRKLQKEVDVFKRSEIERILGTKGLSTSVRFPQQPFYAVTKFQRDEQCLNGYIHQNSMEDPLLLVLKGMYPKALK